jgi:hypothetical protein
MAAPVVTFVSGLALQSSAQHKSSPDAYRATGRSRLANIGMGDLQTGTTWFGYLTKGCRCLMRAPVFMA